MRGMRLHVVYVLLVGFIGVSYAQSPSSTPTKAAAAKFSLVEKVPLLSLSGSPEQIGQQEARLVADRAKTLLSFGPSLVKRRAGEAAWKAHAIVSRALLEHASPSHREEIA